LIYCTQYNKVDGVRFQFTELYGFTRRWRKELGLGDDDLHILQVEIMEDADGEGAMRGTGGLRKRRFAPPSWRTGKSGAIRVGYAVYPESARIVLVTAFAKSTQANLTRDERNGIRQLLERIGQALAEGE
jgi:hypothetical protein